MQSDTKDMLPCTNRMDSGSLVNVRLNCTVYIYIAKLITSRSQEYTVGTESSHMIPNDGIKVYETFVSHTVFPRDCIAQSAKKPNRHETGYNGHVMI